MKLNNITHEVTIQERRQCIKAFGDDKKLYELNGILETDDYTDFIVGLRNYIDRNNSHEDLLMLHRRLRRYVHAIVEAPGIHTGFNANINALRELYMAEGFGRAQERQLKYLKNTIYDLCEACYENVLTGGTLPVSNVNLVLKSADMLAEGLSDILEEHINTITISECVTEFYTSCMYDDMSGGKSIIMLRSDGDDDIRLYIFVREVCCVLYRLYCDDEIDELSYTVLQETGQEYEDEYEAHDNITSLLALGFIRKAGWDVSTQDFINEEYTKEQQEIIENFAVFVAKRVVETLTMNPETLPYICHPVFSDAREEPEHFYNDPETFDYINYNPQGLTGVGDDMFQVLRHFMKDVTDREITDLIIKEQVAHGISILDGPAKDRIIRDNLDFTAFTVKGLSLCSIVEEGNFSPETEDVIIRCGSYLYMYNPKKKKFFGAAPIPKYSRVSKVWIRSDAV